MTPRKKMARTERAKQFLPFAALKGYPEALRRTEEEVLRSYEGMGAQDPETERDCPGTGRISSQSYDKNSCGKDKKMIE